MYRQVTHREVPGVKVHLYRVSCSDLMEANGTETVSDAIVRLLTTHIILISDSQKVHLLWCFKIKS